MYNELVELRTFQFRIEIPQVRLIHGDEALLPVTSALDHLADFF